MPTKLFGAFFEVFAEGVVLTVGLITTVCFAERCIKRSAPLNVTGLAASVIAVFYSVYGELFVLKAVEHLLCCCFSVRCGRFLRIRQRDLVSSCCWWYVSLLYMRSPRVNVASGAMDFPAFLQT